MSGELESAASDLGKDILIVNFLNISSNKIDFISGDINRYYKSKSKGLSAGVIIAIVLLLTFVLIITFACIILILIRKKKKKKILKEASFHIMNYQNHRN